MSWILGIGKEDPGQGAGKPGINSNQTGPERNQTWKSPLKLWPIWLGVLATAGADASPVERVVPIVVNHHKPAALAAIPEGRVVFMADKYTIQAPTGEEFAATAANFFAAAPE